MADDDIMGILDSIESCYGGIDNQAIPVSTSYLNPRIPNSSKSNRSVVPPPLPSRPETSRCSRCSNYSSYYSPCSRPSPGLDLPGIGSYRSPYSRYGMPHNSYNSFIQLAEESTRPAFESIESVVDIVGSISMMLESTYHAVNSFYGSILGVVDQFAQLKDRLAQVLSFLALLRGLRYLCLKVLYLLRLRKDNPARFHNDGKSPWPFFMFIGIVFGAPWLMLKLLSKSVAKVSFDVRSWKGKEGYAICVGDYDFKSTRRGELSFSAGEPLCVAPNYLQANAPRGWILACNRSNKVGLVPVNYLKTSSRQKVSRPVASTSYATGRGAACAIPTDTCQNNEMNPVAFEDEPGTTENVLNPVSKEQITVVD